jgi:hypothetical protein
LAYGDGRRRKRGSKFAEEPMDFPLSRE